MRVFVVSYDLHQPGQNYPAVQKRLEQLGAKRFQFSHWVVKGEWTYVQLRDDLAKYLDPNDTLMVIDVTNAPMAWTGPLKVDIKTAFNLS